SRSSGGRQGPLSDQDECQASDRMHAGEQYASHGVVRAEDDEWDADEGDSSSRDDHDGGPATGVSGTQSEYERSERERKGRFPRDIECKDQMIGLTEARVHP